jgi:tRNA/tmRNA/rRNA uracil-C5-methylase (TrmA/RlmC/RlmD family)
MGERIQKLSRVMQNNQINFYTVKHNLQEMKHAEITRGTMIQHVSAKTLEELIDKIIEDWE